MIIEKFLDLFPQHRRMKERMRRALERESFTHRSMLAMADLAYDRRTALRQIVECETSGSNGTVRRITKIAKDALNGADSDTSILAGDDKPAAFVRHVVTMQGGGGGGGNTHTGGIV